MNILVTGGAGFIGSHLSENLIGSGHKIICIDNFNDYYDPAIKENNIAGIINNKDFTLYRRDICSLEQVKKIFKGHEIDLVIHLAAMAGVRPSIAQPLLYEKVNISGTMNLLECCREFKVLKFIFASSSSVYGGNKKVPFSEDDNVDHPISPYAATKKAGELICHTYHSLFGLSIFCFRFFTVYGPRQRPEMAIHKFTRHILNDRPIEIYGDGSSSRDYTYIDDIISGISGSIDSLSGYEVINLGNSRTVGLNSLIGIIEKATGKKAILKYGTDQPGDMFMTNADIRKAKKIIAYDPETGIDKGINNFVKWYRQEIGKGYLK